MHIVQIPKKEDVERFADLYLKKYITNIYYKG